MWISTLTLKKSNTEIRKKITARRHRLNQYWQVFDGTKCMILSVLRCDFYRLVQTWSVKWAIDNSYTHGWKLFQACFENNTRFDRYRWGFDFYFQRRTWLELQNKKKNQQSVERLTVSIARQRVPVLDSCRSATGQWSVGNRDRRRVVGAKIDWTFFFLYVTNSFGRPRLWLRAADAAAGGQLGN